MFKRYSYVKGLTSLNGSNGKFLINIFGQIKDEFGNDVPWKLDDEGHKTVNVEAWEGLREYRVIDLIALQFKELRIPKEAYSSVIAFVIDGNKENVHANNVGYRFLNGKLEVPGFNGFYYVPGVTGIAINVSGDAMSTRTLKRLSWTISKPNSEKNIKGGYRHTGVYFDHKAVTLGRHRAMCLVFKGYPDNCDTLITNHKDGIPGNDWIDNLEWITRGQNNKHAYENDLKNQHRRVLVRDVITGEVTEYYSISECERRRRNTDTSGGGSTFYRLTNCPFGKVFSDGIQMKYKDDARDWIIPEDPIAEIAKAQFTVKITVRACSDLTVKEYESTTAAGIATGVNHTTIALRANNGDSRPCFGYQFKLASDSSEWYSFTEEEYRESLKDSKFSVDARNHFTSEVLSFDSVRKAMEFAENKNVALILRRGEQPLLPNGWQFKLSADNWQEYDDVEKQIYKNTKEVMAREEATGLIIISDSARKMAEALGKDPKAIRKAAMTNGHKVKWGYRFRLGLNNDSWPTT